MSANRELPEQTIRRFITNTMSATGAGAIGLGIGTILPQPVPFWAVFFLLSGIAIHGVAMLRAHRDDARMGMKAPLWSQIFNWLCWLVLFGLAGLAAYVFPK
jgi:Mn2+/Fe2+ NRAMP family transporter